MNENFNKELQEQIEVTKEKVEQNQQEIVEDLKYQLEEANNSGYNSSLSHQQLESEKHEQFSQLRVEMEKDFEQLIKIQKEEMHEFQEKVQREKEKELEEKINEFESSVTFSLL